MSVKYERTCTTGHKQLSCIIMTLSAKIRHVGMTTPCYKTDYILIPEPNVQFAVITLSQVGKFCVSTCSSMIIIAVTVALSHNRMRTNINLKYTRVHMICNVFYSGIATSNCIYVVHVLKVLLTNGVQKSQHPYIKQSSIQTIIQGGKQSVIQKCRRWLTP